MEIETPDNITVGGKIKGSEDTIITKGSSGTLTLVGNNSEFKGTFVQGSGKTNVGGKYFAGISSITKTSILELRDGADLSSGGSIGLWDRGAMKIVTADDIEIRAAITGTQNTVIDNESSGTVMLSGDNTGFLGRYYQLEGVTLVKGSYFRGVSIITRGILEFGEGSGALIGEIGVLGDGVFRINRTTDLNIGGQIRGTGTIQKPGNGLLTISGINGFFDGEFKQSGGVTRIADIASMFKGTHTIESSLLQVTMPNIVEDRDINYRVELSTGGILEHETTGPGDYSTSISKQSIRFIGDNAKAVFKGNGHDGTWYVLWEGFEDLGEGNEVEFERCYVNVQNDRYGGRTKHRFNNTTIDIDNISVLLRRRVVEFENFVTRNSYLNTTIIVTPEEASGSKLKVLNNPDEPGAASKIQLGEVTVGELGEHVDVHRVQLLEGEIAFEEDSESRIATMEYEYEIKVASEDHQTVIVTANKVTDGNSLGKMNEVAGIRALNLSYGYTHTYYPNVDLKEMGAGRFYVEGNDLFVSGFYADASDGKGQIVANGVSLFKATRATNFELKRVKIVKALGDRGAGLLVTTNTANVLVKEVTFSSNTAIGAGGGAIHASEGASLEIEGTEFEGNNAKEGGNGGAIHIQGARVVFLGDSKVEGNIASGKGGGVYLEDGELDIFGSMVFRDNKANGELNGIHMEGASIINFGMPGGSKEEVVEMCDGIKSTGEMGEVNINGKTEVNLGQAGIAFFSLGRTETIVPNLYINDTGKLTILGEPGVKVSRDVRVGENAGIMIAGTSGHGIAVGVGNSFCQEGLLVMNLFSKKANVTRYAGSLVADNNYDLVGSDLINVEDGTIRLSSSTSKLRLKTNDAFRNLETFRWKVYKLMKYGQGCEGEFGKIEWEGNQPKSYLMRYDYLGEYVAVLAEGLAINRPIFALLGICFNQTEVAKTLDYFCDKAYNGAPGVEAANLSGDAKKLGDRLQELMSMIDYGNEIELKEAFFDLSGYFISNMIISRAYDDVKREIYNRIYNYRENAEPEKGIWGQAKGMRIDTDKDIESPDKFKVTNIGILVGFDDFDMMTSSTVMTGAYVKHNKSLIKQGNDLHNADVNSIGVGMYVAVLEEKYDIKALGSFSFDNYETTRNIRFEKNTKAKGEFRGNSTKIDVEAGYRIGIGNNRILGNMKLRPYIGAGLTFVHTEGFREKGTSIWNLDVRASNYTRAEVGGGIGFTGNGTKYGKKFRWNISCGLGCILAGKNEEIKSKFIVGDNLLNELGNSYFKSKSVTLDAISVVGEIGMGYYISEGLEGYCSCDTRIGAMVKDVCANVGVRYSFDN
ncbi:MAG: hypothetical protein LBD17_04105 [Endomicrobium sp.]|nr:hypothetical protein [Endomicrobium sp.]